MSHSGKYNPDEGRVWQNHRGQLEDSIERRTYPAAVPEQYMTVGEFVEELLRGEPTVERLKAYGNELDRYTQEYSDQRGTSGYRREVTSGLTDLVGYLRAGHPEQMKDGTVDFLWDGDPRKALIPLATELSLSLSFWNCCNGGSIDSYLG